MRTQINIAAGLGGSRIIGLRYEAIPMGLRMARIDPKNENDAIDVMQYLESVLISEANK